VHFNLTKAILAEQFCKKLKTETASFDAYSFRNLSNNYVDPVRVHICQSVKHARSGAYETMNVCICA
jgi:hypothetical protein